MRNEDIMPQRFEKGALNVYHYIGDSFAACYSNDKELQSASIKIEITWVFPKKHYFS